MKVIVSGRVETVGIRSHVIEAEDRVEAWEKFCRAYAKRECTLIKFETLMGKAIWMGKRK